MTMGNFLCSFLTTAVLVSTAAAQERTPAPHGGLPTAIPPARTTIVAPGVAGAPPLFAARMIEPPENQDDPGYTLYKEGYSLILEEQWNEAREKLGSLISKYPRSEYVDDAQYWSAYALMQTDTKKAVQAYEKFIKSYPKSSYYDDAVADLGQLRSNVYVITNGPSIIKAAPHPDVKGFRYEFGPNSRQFDRQMLKMERQLSRLRVKTPHLPALIAPRAPRENIDKETQLRMEALYALGDGKEDEKSFQTVKEVALNARQPRPLREAAMDVIAQYEKFDALPVFVEIARTDTNEFIQSYAIDYIGERGKDKDKTVDALADLFYGLPKNRKEQTRSIFYAIADVGNDKAVDFLTKVALSHDDYDLRTDAVYYLGSIGGEKARSALYQILNEKR